MKCYIYCTKAKPYLLKIKSEEVDFMCNYKQWLIDNDNRYRRVAYNNTIVASFDLNKIEKMGLDTNKGLEFINNFNKESQLTLEEIVNYVGDNYYYAWHIENLKILDEPMELSHFRSYKLDDDHLFKRFDKAPQSWCYACLPHCTPMYVECNYIGDDVDFEDCIIISIKPEWVCKILNGEKTIEIRKTAPKELIR